MRKLRSEITRRSAVNCVEARNSWWNFALKEKLEGGKTISANVALDDTPLFVRAGEVIPFGPLKQYTSEPVDEPITLRVYPGKDECEWRECDVSRFPFAEALV
jgi:alpha-glucosidase (family GH31 glycosyl hydrolase)